MHNPDENEETTAEAPAPTEETVTSTLTVTVEEPPPPIEGEPESYIEVADPVNLTELEEQYHHDGYGFNDLLVVFADEPGAGNAPHLYEIGVDTPDGVGVLASIAFQHGPPDEGINGITTAALLGLLINRFMDFQSSEFACAENAKVILRLTQALNLVKARAKRRAEEGTLGTMTPEKEA